MAIAPPRCIVFDFDLTLADSSIPAVECIRFALTELGRAAVSFEAAQATIGLSLSETFETLTGEIDPRESQRFRHLFLDRAEEIMVDRTQLFETTVPTLAGLHERGLPLGIASTKDRHMILGILQRFALDDAFHVIVGGDDVKRSKPAPDGLNQALNALGCAPSEALFIGDSLVDAETARRAEVPFIAVLSGTTPAKNFASYRPRHVLGYLEELLQCL